MKNKRFTVFVSSTYSDLQNERKEVMQTLLKMDFIPCGMELFPASSEEQWSFIKSVIDDCDYYLLILGGKYGSESPQGIGYTEMEYRYAESIGKPTISFVYRDIQKLPGAKLEFNSPQKLEKYQKFREHVMGKLVCLWDDEKDLSIQVSTSMRNLVERFPAQGWIRYSEGTVDTKDYMGLHKIHKSRQYMNRVLNENTMSRQLDTCAFGLRSFRDAQENEFVRAIENGLAFRYLALDPSSEFLRFQEVSERVVVGEVKKAVTDSISYFEKVKKATGGNISIRLYDSLPLDMYWRQDDILATGPYMYGKTSQITITYEYRKGSDGFAYYEDYFEKLWSNENFARIYI